MRMRAERLRRRASEQSGNAQTMVLSGVTFELLGEDGTRLHWRGFPLEGSSRALRAAIVL